MAEQTVELAPDESKEVSFEATPHEARTYQISVDGLGGSFTATAPQFVISDLSIPKPELRLGEQGVISVKVTNISDKTIWAEVNLSGDLGPDYELTPNRKQKWELSAGRSTIAVWFFRVFKSGEYNVFVDGLEGTFTVTDLPAVGIASAGTGLFDSLQMGIPLPPRIGGLPGDEDVLITWGMANRNNPHEFACIFRDGAGNFIGRSDLSLGCDEAGVFEFGPIHTPYPGPKIYDYIFELCLNGQMLKLLGRWSVKIQYIYVGGY